MGKFDCQASGRGESLGQAAAVSFVPMSDSVSPQTAAHAPLGQATEYPAQYNPGLLFSIARDEARSNLSVSAIEKTSASERTDDNTLPFHGADLWNAYEVSWLGPTGKPEVRAARLRVPCESPAIIESKSLKLYLNSLNQHRFDSAKDACATIEADLSRAAGMPVAVRLFTTDELEKIAFPSAHAAGARCLDSLDVSVQHYNRDPRLLRIVDAAAITTSVLYTDLFKSNCPVTGQPDWASVFIEYRGPKIDEEALLAYLISYRNEQDFHEHCVEKIFVDLNERCQPEQLTVYACFLRRGGLDISPFRSNFQVAPDFLRSARQ